MVKKIFYRGISMNPLMRSGDILLVVPSESQTIHPGDVVLYVDPNRGQVVHRVVAVNSQGVITKGDNMPDVDDRILAPQEILGRVTAIQRQGRTLPVPREAPAALYLLKGRQWFDRTIFRLIQPLYHRLAQSGLFQGPLTAWMKPRVIYFSRGASPEWQLWLGKLLIGRKKPHQSEWSIRRPFRLFVDEASLPSHSPPPQQTSG